MLIALALIAVADYGCSERTMRYGEPAGWKTERWQAGFGSWGSGGYAVAYDISMPANYHFMQKCGAAWISDDTEGPDFDIRLSFLTVPQDRQYDFQTYLKEDAGRYYEKDPSLLIKGSATTASFAGDKMSRVELKLENVQFLDDDAGGDPKSGDAKGFWLEGDKLSVISDLRDPQRLAINERIVASARKTKGYTLTDLIGRTIPGLLGC